MVLTPQRARCAASSTVSQGFCSTVCRMLDSDRFMARTSNLTHVHDRSSLDPSFDARYRDCDCSRWSLTSPQGRRPGTGRELRVGRDSRTLLVLDECLEHEITHTLLCARIGDRTQQCKAATLTIDGVLARRERHVAAGATAPFPYGEADQLQAVELSVDEMQLGIREFAGRVAAIVRRDSYDDTHDVTSGKLAIPASG